jgi:hypothetical protein
MTTRRAGAQIAVMTMKASGRAAALPGEVDMTTTSGLPDHNEKPESTQACTLAEEF